MSAINKLPDPIEMVELHHLPEHLQEVATTCGIDTVRVLLRNCAGMELHIPQVKNLPGLTEEYLAVNYRKGSLLQIMRRLNCTRGFIYKKLKQ